MLLPADKDLKSLVCRRNLPFGDWDRGYLMFYDLDKAFLGAAHDWAPVENLFDTLYLLSKHLLVWDC